MTGDLCGSRLSTRRVRQEIERALVAIFERDADGDAWLVQIDDIAECHTYGRTRHQAGVRIRQALAVWLDRDPGDLTIKHR